MDSLLSYNSDDDNSNDSSASEDYVHRKLEASMTSSSSLGTKKLDKKEMRYSPSPPKIAAPTKSSKKLLNIDIFADDKKSSKDDSESRSPTPLPQIALQALEKSSKEYRNERKESSDNKKERKRDRDRERNRDHDRTERDRDRSDRDRSDRKREKDRDVDKSRDKDRDRSRDRDRDRSRDRDRERKDRHRDRGDRSDRDRIKDRDRSKRYSPDEKRRERKRESSPPSHKSDRNRDDRRDSYKRGSPGNDSRSDRNRNYSRDSNRNSDRYNSQRSSSPSRDSRDRNTSPSSRKNDYHNSRSSRGGGSGERDRSHHSGLAKGNKFFMQYKQQQAFNSETQEDIAEKLLSEQKALHQQQALSGQGPHESCVIGAGIIGSKDLNIPSYYNPNVVNPLKIAEQVQKRKLLWSHKKNEDTAAKKWDGALFTQDNDGKVASKFMRLMGIKSQGEASATAANGNSTDPTTTQPNINPESIKKREQMFSSMEQQYEVARAVTHTMRGVGLGFGSAAAPKHL